MIRTTVVQLMMRKFNLFSKIYTMGYLLEGGGSLAHMKV